MESILKFYTIYLKWPIVKTTNVCTSLTHMVNDTESNMYKSSERRQYCNLVQGSQIAQPTQYQKPE